ncbi:MAG: VOC family protein [Planctomycetota bacterium]
MQKPFYCGVGGVVSTDIAVPNHVKQHEFYSSILTTGEDPFWRDDLLNYQGTPIIGLGSQSDEFPDLPLQWIPHFQVDSVAQKIVVAQSLGAKILFQSTDGEIQHHWAGGVDSSGAAFGLITSLPADRKEYQSDRGIDSICGLTLSVEDLTRTTQFYEEVVGWTASESETENEQSDSAVVQMLGPDKFVAAHIFQIPDNKNTEQQHRLPSVWLIYLPVGDLEFSLRKVINGGGSVISKSSGDSAVIRDPEGVYLGLKAGDSNRKNSQ